ncbi:MAG: ribosome assembly cofactor RimP [Bacteroidetes bacterium]|nr:ribosome assembly cofactor RimP [Bacteroidota bacterium]
MLKNKIRENTLFIETAPLVQKIGLILVDISESEQQNSIQIRVVIKAQDRITTIEDCTKVHKLLEPRLELLVNNKDLQIEVSTPGLQRNLKDYYEFELFTGENVKIYDDRISDWLTGKISGVKTDEEVLILDQSINNDIKFVEIPYTFIKKAKLEVIWEEKK